MFRNREDAARQLATKLKGRSLHEPLVLAIPRGGVVTGAVLARELGAGCDGGHPSEAKLLPDELIALARRSLQTLPIQNRNLAPAVANQPPA